MPLSEPRTWPCSRGEHFCDLIEQIAGSVGEGGGGDGHDRRHTLTADAWSDSSSRTTTRLSSAQAQTKLTDETGRAQHCLALTVDDAEHPDHREREDHLEVGHHEREAGEE